MTIADNEAVVEDDICSQFLISEDDVGKNVHLPLSLAVIKMLTVPFSGPKQPFLDSRNSILE